jgi:thermostable 8-oxoguanine DNA glycosylase
MGPKHYQASGGGEVATLVEEIEQTGDRLAAAVEALAFKKAHLKDEFIEIAEEKADQFLEKAEETKDQLVARISDKIPDRRELKEMASKAVAKVGDSAGEAKDTVVEKAAEAEHRIAAVAAERLPEAKEAASDVAEKVVDTVSRAGETAVNRLRRPRHPAVNPTPDN